MLPKSSFSWYNYPKFIGGYVYLLNDFFLLSWSENSDSIEDIPNDTSKAIYETYRDNYEEFYQSCSILFIINSENFEKIVGIEEFKKLFGGVFKNKIANKCLVLQMQKRVLEFIVELGNLDLNKRLKKSFEILRKEGIISYYISRRLIGLFALIREKKEEIKQIDLEIAEKDKNFYKNSLNILKASITNLFAVNETKSIRQRVKQVELKLLDEKFSIGVTGIINSGKSTLLNALLKEEILGTAVVPETANLTLLRYSKERFAKVNFWSRREFARIEESAENRENIKRFIDETKRHFGNSLSKYIQEESRIVDVDIDDLALFTSAEKSDKKCNLIKSVELYSDLEFLKDGVEIVDTPGLDDPIVQREEITLSYVSECDLMMHLMNVNQSATQKDVDFIIDSILYQNISRLLIVITRIDTVSAKELDEVILYTKKSIGSRLKEQNRSYKLDFILKKIEFIAVSGKMALLLRTQQEELAKKSGYDLEKSGILKIERYLQSVLFGSNSQKANLIIQSNKNELLSIVEQLQNSFTDEESLLNKSNHEIKEEYRKFKLKREEIAQRLFEVRNTIKKEERELKDYFKILHKFLYEKLLGIKDIAKSRIMDDVSYEMRKNKKLPQKKRIDYMVETALKDGLVDLFREYRYEFEKRMRNAFDTVARTLRVEFKEEKNREFDSKEFFEKNFKQLRVFQNRTVLLEKINVAIKLYAKKSTDRLNTEIDRVLQKTIDDLWSLLLNKIEDTDKELLNNFISINQKRVLEIEDEMKIKEELLRSMMESMKSSATDKNRRLEEIRGKKEVLMIVKKDLESANESI